MGCLDAGPMHAAGVAFGTAGNIRRKHRQMQRVHRLKQSGKPLIRHAAETKTEDSIHNDIGLGGFGSRIFGDHKVGAATHGGSPTRNEVTTFMAAGPNVIPGVVVETRSMVDEAPTMARMLGFTMPDTDGTAIEEILR